MQVIVENNYKVKVEIIS